MNPPSLNFIGCRLLGEDIKPLFRAVDVSHMKKAGVRLDDYSYMSNPEHAHKVLATLSPLTGKPPVSGIVRRQQCKL
jgi:hypothetical protein